MGKYREGDRQTESQSTADRLGFLAASDAPPMNQGNERDRPLAHSSSRFTSSRSMSVTTTS